MANEFQHKTVGTELTQAEFEDIALHVFNGQATGDIMYASGAAQLSRLAIGAANTVLTSVGGVPAWSSTTITANTMTYPSYGRSCCAVTNQYNNLMGGPSAPAGGGGVIQAKGSTSGSNPGSVMFYTPGAGATNDQRMEIAGMAAVTRISIKSGAVLNVNSATHATPIEGDIKIVANKLNIYLGGAWEVVTSV